jgi:uncharacterized protein
MKYLYGLFISDFLKLCFANLIHVLVGVEAGPVLYVQEAVHGDEVNGVEALRRVVTGLDPQQMKGVLIVVPVVNGPSFVNHQRRNP